MYSSQTEAKRSSRPPPCERHLGNHSRHRRRHWIHASLGEANRRDPRPEGELGIDLTIQIYTDPKANLLGSLPTSETIQIVPVALEDASAMPMHASRRAIQQAKL